MSTDRDRHLALDFPFTRQDTPELRARIRRDLARAWRRVTDADPRASALILTGGFSRGEGTAVGPRPLNDYDLVVVRDKPWPPVRDAYAGLREELEDDLALHVDLLPILRARLPHVGSKVFWFDVKHGGRVLAGDPRVLDRIPVDDARHLRPGEATRLLANRAVGLLEALPGTERSPDATTVRMQSAKAVLAAVEAALVLQGRYAPTVTERLERFRTVGKTLPRGEAGVDWVGLAEWATAFKLDPSGPARSKPPEEAWENARHALLACATHAFPRAGWGPFDAYPRGAPFDPVEWAFACLQERRFAPLKASHRVRADGFRLLGDVTWPGRLNGAAWPEPLNTLQAARARTLH